MVSTWIFTILNLIFILGSLALSIVSIGFLRDVWFQPALAEFSLPETIGTIEFSKL